MSGERTEKQLIEKATAELFINLINNKFGTNYCILHLGDSPDVTCEDQNSCAHLDLEITLIEDHPGDIQYLLGRKGNRTLSPTTGLPITSSDDAYNSVVKALKNKAYTSYGPHTALVIRQTSPLWYVSDWKRELTKIPSEIVIELQKNYDFGVWIICTNNDCFPATDDLFCFIEPGTPLGKDRL